MDERESVWVPVFGCASGIVVVVLGTIGVGFLFGLGLRLAGL